MAETTKRGVHALENKIHEIEAEDRAAEGRREEKREARPDERDATTPRRPPPAHEE
jgi:hypothetical protein